jgi:nucleotide sugar dehydrogenase
MEKLNSTEFEYDVVVIGLGFVGLTLALKLAEHCFVLGIEKDITKMNLINDAISPFYEEGINDLLQTVRNNNMFEVINKPQDFKRINKKKTIFIVTVGTPVTNTKSNTKNILIDLLTDIYDLVKDDDLIIFRSTISVGTTLHAHNWFLNKGKNVNFSFCPERTIEGKALQELSSLPQIISGTSNQAIEMATQLFSLFCTNILCASNTNTAELAKLASNIERDVYFSFANELGFISKELNVNFSELKNLVTTNYSRSYLKEVGPVAGPCLEKDTYILKESLNNEYKMDLIESARNLNEKWIYKVSDELIKIIISENFKNICITGLAFKGNPPTSDLRGSLAINMYNYLKGNNFNVFLFDPTIEKEEIKKHFNASSKFILNDINDVTKNCDFLVLQNGSTYIVDIIKNTKINCIDISTFNSRKIKTLF